MAELVAMPKYEAYKESGFDWLGKIPSSWKVNRFKFLLDEINDRSESGGEDLLSVSHYTGVTLKSDKVNDGDLLTNAETLEGYKKVTKGDLVSNIMLAWNGSLGISPYDGITSPAYSIYRFRKGCSERFYHYLLRTEIYKAEFKRRSTGVIESRLRLYSDAFFDVIGVLPPINTQLSIANFLDKKTAQLDEAIAIKEKQIELLKERKQIIIQQSVTQGISYEGQPNAPMKDSGVDWIGEIPEHWEVKKIKYLGRIINGYAFSSDSFVETGVRVMKISNIQTMRIDWTDESFVDKTFLKTCSNFQIFNGDLVFALTRPIISTGIKATIVDSEDEILLNQRNAVLRPNKICMKTWLYYMILNNSFVNEFSNQIDRTGQQPNISTVSISNISIPVPPKNEQITITDYIGRSFSNLDRSIEVQFQQIEKLKEYKTTLINSAVTGKIKVPEVDSGC